jgi:predicted ester cyclase
LAVAASAGADQEAQHLPDGSFPADGLEITWMGTHSGPLELPSGTLPATGKTVEFDDAQVYVIEGGKVAQIRNYIDMLSMLSQVGAI